MYAFVIRFRYKGAGTLEKIASKFFFFDRTVRDDLYEVITCYYPNL